LYLTCIEKCHDALEKLLKGIITENDKQPLKIHDLLRLVSEALVEKSLDEVETGRIFKETKRIFSWLEKKLKQNYAN